MKQSDKQWAFLRDVATLISYIGMCGWKASGGDLFRSYAEQQRVVDAGLSKAKPGSGRHEARMAIDLNFWDESGKYLPDLDRKTHDTKFAHIADFWESINPKNKAGFFFTSLYDPYHFERLD